MNRSRLAAIALISFIVLIVLSVVFAPGLAWRSQVVLLKAQGQIKDIEWGELLPMLRPDSPIWLGGMPESRSAYASIVNPYVSQADLDMGSSLFFNNCASCHGFGDGGNRGTDFSSEHLRFGDSDWAIYRSIRRGIEGTGMAPHQQFADMEVWQIVAFVRSLQNAGATAINGDDVDAVISEYLSVTSARLNESDLTSGDWLTYSGSYSGQRHSMIDQINKKNVHTLRLIWSLDTGSQQGLEVTPLVNGRYMYLSVAPDALLAVDANTGELIWRAEWSVADDPVLCCGVNNRGAALLDDKVFVGTVDARLLAFDARTGGLLWDKDLRKENKGYSITSAPLAIEDKIIVGLSGGGFGLRGVIEAVDAQSGDTLWRTYTVPGPGEPGNDSWGGDSWKTGGAAPWLTGSFDPELGLLYWGTGNPAPLHNGDSRPGDNLYANSVLALDYQTGKIRWYFQFTPHDLHDMDSVQIPVIVDAEYKGKPRKLLLWANRNGFFYVLDRQTGEFLSGEPFVHQTWAKSLDSNGRPIVNPEAKPDEKGTVVYPSVGGATNWWSPSYSPTTGLIYVPTIERPSVYFKSEDKYKEGVPYSGGYARSVTGFKNSAKVKAIDYLTGKVRWENLLARRTGNAAVAGIMSTMTGLVVVGDDRVFYILDADTGDQLWETRLGATIQAAPISYLSSDIQRLTIAAGGTIYTFGLPETIN